MGLGNLGHLVNPLGDMPGGVLDTNGIADPGRQRTIKVQIGCKLNAQNDFLIMLDWLTEYHQRLNLADSVQSIGDIRSSDTYTARVVSIVRASMYLKSTRRCGICQISVRPNAGKFGKVCGVISLVTSLPPKRLAAWRKRVELLPVHPFHRQQILLAHRRLPAAIPRILQLISPARTSWKGEPVTNTPITSVPPEMDVSLVCEETLCREEVSLAHLCSVNLRPIAQ